MTFINRSLESESLNLVEGWVRDFETRLINDADLRDLFLVDSYWRDAVAFTGSILTTSGSSEIAEALKDRNGSVHAHSFKVSVEPAPQLKTRAGKEVTEAFFDFLCDSGTGRGVVRLVAEGGSIRAWTILTALQTLTGFDEPTNSNRPRGGIYAHNFGQPNWADRRKNVQEFSDREPEVLIVGGGHAGMMLAARLARLGVDALVVDRNQRVGDNWRLRYNALALHNEAWVCEMPFMSYPPTWPVYLPKDMLADWLETYSTALELNYWTNSQMVSATYDPALERWTAHVIQGGLERELRPQHVVIATGLSGAAKIPSLPGLDEFDGTIIHSSRFTTGAEWVGKHVTIVGAGNSAHDVAQDLYEHGAASVTMIQRTATTITSVEPAAQLVFALYSEGPSIADSDLLATSLPYELTLAGQKLLTKLMYDLDKPLLDKLESVGFRTDLGVDESGYYMKYLRTGGGYYLNVGCSELIANGKIKVIPSDNVERYSSEGGILTDGEVFGADLIVLATGYENLQDTTRQLFGAQVSNAVGPVWGFDSRGDVSNMWRETAQAGLWYMAGSFAQSRTYSRYLAFQIKASLDSRDHE